MGIPLELPGGPGYSRDRMRIRPACALASILFLGFGAAGLRAEEPDTDGELPPEIPRPDFVRNRPYIPDLLLKDKREGFYVTGIPALGWDAEEGLNVGAFFELFWNGSKDDPLFRTAPYRRKLFVGGLVTTEEVWRILGRWDEPYFRDTPYRLRADFLYEKSDINNYYGQGGQSIPLISPRTGTKYTKYDRYQEDLNVFVEPGMDGCPPGPNQCTYSRYNQYKAEEVIAVFSVERDLFGGLVRPMLGFQLRYVNVDDYTGELVRRLNKGGKGIELPTRLFDDCASGLVRDCNGGWDNAVRMGLSYDSRDFEPNPGHGVLAEMVLALGAEALGSDQDYQRLTFSWNGYHDFLSESDGAQQLILAGRAMYNMVFGDPGFYTLSRLGFVDHDVSGLGGFSTMRAYKSQRFQGESAVLLNAELRWFFTEWTLWEQNLRPGLAVFGDGGRTWRDVDLSFDRWRFGGGFGFRLAWNLATLISFDLGLSPENNIFYLELGTTF